MTSASPNHQGWTPLGHLGKPTGHLMARTDQPHPQALPLRWSHEVQRTMERNSTDAYPGEGCGFLLGLDGPDGAASTWPSKSTTAPVRTSCAASA